MDGLRRLAHIGVVVTLVALALFYLQFGLQALAHFIPQGVLALLGGAALAWGAIRKARRRAWSSLIFWGTLPVLLLHFGLTLQDSGELPFLVGSVPAPFAAAIAWLVLRGSRRDDAQRSS